MSLTSVPPRSATLASAIPAPSGALLTVTLATPAASPFLSLTFARTGDDDDPTAGQTLPALNLRAGDPPALCAALDDVRRAHTAMG